MSAMTTKEMLWLVTMELILMTQMTVLAAQLALIGLSEALQTSQIETSPK